MKVYTKPTTINITIDNRREKTRTVTLIVDNHKKDTIEKLKDEVNELIVKPLTDEKGQNTTLYFRKDNRNRAGSLKLKTTRTNDEIAEEFIKRSQ